MVGLQIDIAGSPTKERPAPTKPAQPPVTNPSDQVQRTEHDRLIRGEGAFTADRAPEHQLHLAVVRSTIASGTIKSLDVGPALSVDGVIARSEEHTSELQSLMRISYAVFCLKKKKITKQHNITTSNVKKTT